MPRENPKDSAVNCAVLTFFLNIKHRIMTLISLIQYTKCYFLKAKSKLIMGNKQSTRLRIIRILNNCIFYMILLCEYLFDCFKSLTNCNKSYGFNILSISLKSELFIQIVRLTKITTTKYS